MIFYVEKQLDRLGRLVLPKNMRELYEMKLNEKVKLVPVKNGILITRCVEDELVGYGDGDESAKVSKE